MLPFDSEPVLSLASTKGYLEKSPKQNLGLKSWSWLPVIKHCLRELSGYVMSSYVGQVRLVRLGWFSLVGYVS